MILDWGGFGIDALCIGFYEYGVAALEEEKIVLSYE
jgi:hypothetical protein